MVILITGCRSGIGLSIAIAAANKGYIVYAGLRDLNTKDNLVSQSEDLDIIPVQLDVTKDSERKTVIQQIIEEQGRLDILINNAGIGIGGFLEEITEEEMRRSFDVNFFGVWSLSKECLPCLGIQRCIGDDFIIVGCYGTTGSRPIALPSLL